MEYEGSKLEPGRVKVKDIDQLANEKAHRQGVTVASLKKPSHWNGW